MGENVRDTTAPSDPARSESGEGPEEIPGGRTCRGAVHRYNGVTE